MMLPKDYLSIEDFADYLNSLGSSYDLSVSRDHFKLHKDIYDLIIQKKISLVFHYTGWIKETICDNDIDEASGKLKNCKSKDMYTSVYFKTCQTLAKEMLLDNKITTTKSSFNLYCFEDGKRNPDVTHTFYLYDIIDDNEQNITANDLYIPRSEIDKLFNNADKIPAPTITQTELESNKERIADLENQLAQAKAKLADKPAGDNFEQDHLYNWQAMDKNQYPPELHLAIEIWIEYYQADVIEHISQFDAGRFNRIANKFNLSNGNLKSRIRSLLTPLESKLKSPSLIDSLKEIDIIHTDKLDQD